MEQHMISTGRHLADHMLDTNRGAMTWASTQALPLAATPATGR
jgi:hypothetical protein